MKIGTKLIAIIITMNLIGFAVLIWTTQRRSRLQITEVILENAENMSARYAGEVKNWMEVPLDQARALADIMEGYQAIPAEERRFYFNYILRQIAENNPDYIAVWSCWEPDALDGMDADNRNTQDCDDSGRFVSYWHRANGKVQVEPLENYGRSGDGDYYQIPLKTGKEAIIEPYPYTIGGRTLLITSLSVPIKKDGIVVGVAGIDIALEKIQTFAEAIRPYGDGISAVFSNGGIVAGHFDSTRLGRQMRESERDMNGDYTDTVAESVRRGEPLSYSVKSNAMDTDFTIVSSPFSIGETGTPWALLVGIPMATVMAPVYRMLLFSIPTGVAILIVICIAAVLVARSITKPINRMVVMFRDISEGEGDLTKTINMDSKDEIGDMAHFFNMTLEKIKTLVLIIKNQSQKLLDIGTELSSNMTETAAAVNQITANVQGMKNQVVNQSASVTETNSTMEQITQNIDRLSGHIETQSASVAQSSSAIEEMLANIQSVTQTLVKNAENVRDLGKASEIGRSGLQEVSGEIQEIARESEGLLEITAVMENIASQTNLLSMNAAIEAAHAGDAGKGFAVVADEIRKLAESSGEQSKTIAGVLKKIKEAIDTISRSTGSVLEKFETIDSEVKTVSEQQENIRSAMEEQNAGSQQILEAIGHLHEATQMVKNGAQEMLTGSQEVIRESKNLEMTTQEISNGMNEMASGADQINTAVHRVNEISGENKEYIDILVREISKFKVE
ncbi:methyl-accepting chemotaxis protein [Breznakiella homolactica]|uniref:Methyl-accepting chemotaxis protein n=1 Tax=Breznakiella homolactica TaxID=2798577 RepID=A0A7T8B8J5_9SPIR|nr:methyl-accepting chemotaxis protein [Breznakiella homolactica]QQO07386.1 methyl-accepting chemotaxis protein [Breznakiella homolactica]